jgi:nucleotide-binding universal stress UspA family protein
MYRTLLVPLDGSTFGEHALPTALAVARRAKAAIHLVHVQAPLASIYSEAPLFVDSDLEERIKERQVAQDQDYLDGVAERLKAAADVRVTTAIVEGEVAATLQLQAVRAKVDLVVMTTHGRGLLGRFWLGSVADELIRRLPMPLLLIRPGETAPDLAVEPPLRHLLIPLDGTPLAEQMIEPAVTLGSLTGADYTLLRVVKPVLRPTYFPEGRTMGQMAQTLLEQVQALQEQVRKQARDYLEGIAGPLRARGLTVQTRVTVEEDPAAAILDQASGPAIDLIAVETHGRRGLPRLFLGSVANKVLRGTARPMLVHRPINREAFGAGGV